MSVQVCPVCNGDGRVYRMTPSYEGVVAAANGGAFGWTGPTHEYRTCRVCGGVGTLPSATCKRPHLDDRDALARAMRVVYRVDDGSVEAAADAIIAALREQG